MMTTTATAPLAKALATLTYRRVVRKNVGHTSDGVLYLHHFGTGWQELVFSDHAAAERFANANHCEFKQ